MTENLVPVSAFLMPHALAASSTNRTVIFIFYETLPEQSLFIRGGLDTNLHSGCDTDEVTGDACAIPMRTRLLGTIDHYDGYNAWRAGDNFLDWHGAEAGQGSFYGAPAEGTPLVWTTSNILSPAYQELNTFGDHYWMVDMEMDCPFVEADGWFDVKGYTAPASFGWEPDVTQTACDGTIGGVSPHASVNHMARCGAVNIFEHGGSACTINAFED
ncbi:hypothetical protein HAZT_HAZT001197 [Hyalella azteca]|uniref:Uncharacterized protein n=1 Tax=Hyalella azteca TaxID=294128 RepID=A0A6A0GY30_HYAAZ|nr:hypothetical protein HAZT_HAZT001197 [Hyalella azteca]